MNRFDFEAIWKIQGCGDSATQPRTVGMLSANCCTSQQPELQKLVSKCHKIPTEHGAEHASPVQSCRMSIFSHPVQISQYGTILHLRCNSWQQITRIMVNGKKKTTNKRNREKCQGFDKCLLSVLSQFKAIIKFNLKKDKIEVFQ